MENEAEFEGVRERVRMYFSDFRPVQRRAMVRGIKTTSRISDAQLTGLIDSMAHSSFDPSIAYEPEAAEFGLSQDDFQSLMFAIGKLVAPLTTEKDALTPLFEALRAEFSLEGDDIESVSRLAALLSPLSETVQQQADIKGVSNATLPSFEAIGMSVDIRLRYTKENTVDLAVPVVVCFLDTDVQGQRVWFQLSKADLWDLKRSVDRAIAQYDEADKYVRNYGLSGSQKPH